MTERTYIFHCHKCIKRNSGTIDHYILEVTDVIEGSIETFAVEPKHLASARSMKRILLGRKILYSVTQSTHEKMLNELFAIQPEAI